MVAACALSWGAVGVIVREVSLPPLTIVWIRVLFSTTTVALLILATGRRELLRRPPLGVLALGVLLAVHWSLYFSAIKQTSVASAVLIAYLAPVFMALMAPVLIGERVPAVSIGALVVSVGAIALISLSGGSGGEEVRLVGVVLALGAAATFALLIVLLKRWAADTDPMTVVVYQDGLVALLLTPALIGIHSAPSGADLGRLALLGVVLTGITGVVYVAALRWVPATTAGILAYMEPVSAALLAALLLGQRLTVAVVVGGVAIVAAGVAVVLASPDPIGGSVEGPVAPGGTRIDAART